MKNFEQLIVDLLSTNKRFIQDSIRDISFNRETLSFVIVCEYAVPNHNIPIDNLDSRKETKVYLSLYELTAWATNRKINILTNENINSNWVKFRG